MVQSAWCMEKDQMQSGIRRWALGLKTLRQKIKLFLFRF
jgi:hypothetical protein